MQLDGQSISLKQLACVTASAEAASEVTLGASAIERMHESRRAVERILASGQIVYGINTGFGKLADISIAPDELRQLQLNLVRSHACGVGRLLSAQETRAMLLLRANVLAIGLSGARPVVAETLVAMLRADVLPVVPEKGSVGASGDLAPLAHLALACIGEGEAVYHDERLPSHEALRRAGIAPLTLEAKEGIALLNGTQALTAVGGLALGRALQIVHVADVAGAMTLEALRGTPVAFDPRIQRARPFRGQGEVAAHLRALLANSEIRASHLHDDPRVQDAYSLRCMPQVHGATRDALRHAREQTEIETGSATDNPLVFVGDGAPDEATSRDEQATHESAEREIASRELATDFRQTDVLSGGNFHGAPLALAFDYAAIALAHLGNIGERRIERLVNPDLNDGLPAFLTRHPGISSGFMIAQVTAVALLNEIKVLVHPASADNLPTSANKEDHVSMGMTAALKLRSIIENIEYVFAIELLAAAEGLEYRRPLRPGVGVLRAYEQVRTLVPRLEHDRTLAPDIERIATAIRDGEFGA